MDNALLVGNLAALWIAVVAQFLLLVGLARRVPALPQRATDSPNDNQGMLEAGERLPEFSASTVSGEVVSPSTLLGTLSLLLFASPQCAPCLTRLGELKRQALDLQRLGISCFVVDTEGDGTAESLQALVPPEATIVAAPRTSNTMMADFRIPGTPSYVLVSPSGRVINAGILDGAVGSFLERWGDLLKRDQPQEVLQQV